MFLPTPGALVANRFRLRHAIGKGGMGQVWEAHDRELDSPCAVKFIVDHMAQDPEARLRIVREARAVARLRSPHVVTILGVGEHEDAMYLAMELLEGETLASRLERVRKLDADTTVAIVEQIALVLDKAHSHGIVHRDLKPDNLWLGAGPRPFIKVLDFGVAKTTLSAGSRQTVSGALMGTPQYMSPEQASGDREVDHRSDLWALAIIAIECLSGRRPFESHGLGDLLNKIMNATPPALQALDSSLPAGLGGWWQRALARDPELRFQTAAELLQALRFGLAAAPVAAVSPVFIDTDRGSWTTAPVPPRVPTLVTNVTPMPSSGSSSPVSQPIPLGTFRVQRPVESGASVGPVSNTNDVERTVLGPRGRLLVAASAGACALLVAALWLLRGPPVGADSSLASPPPLTPSAAASVAESRVPPLPESSAPASGDIAAAPSVQDVPAPALVAPPAEPQTAAAALTPAPPGAATAAAPEPVAKASPPAAPPASKPPRKPPRKAAQTPPASRDPAPPAENAKLKARLGF